MNDQRDIFPHMEENTLVSPKSEKVAASITTKLPHELPFCYMWLIELKLFLLQRKNGYVMRNIYSDFVLVHDGIDLQDSGGVEI